IIFPEGLRQDLDSMGAKTIMWSIDSTIRYVPIAALHDGQHYLVTLFRNSLITPASMTRLTQGSGTVWKGVGFGVSQANGNFSALPGVPEELHRIFRQGTTGDAPVAGRVELDRDFTRETFEARPGEAARSANPNRCGSGRAEDCRDARASPSHRPNPESQSRRFRGLSGALPHLPSWMLN